MPSSALVKEAILIPPAEETPTQVLPLSSLDSQLFLRFTIEYLLVYKSPHYALDKPATAARLKVALAQALIPYYPLAGRVRARANGSGLEVVCRAQGAAFIQATSSLTVTEFDTPPREVAEWQNKFLSLHVADVLEGAPQLIVQLTWLCDGSAAIGVGFNHCLCDGLGSVEFLKLFSELATGKKNGLSDLDPNPIWDRYLLNPNKKIQQKLFGSHIEFNVVVDHCNFDARFSQEKLVPTSVILDRRKLNELKELAHNCESNNIISSEIPPVWSKEDEAYVDLTPGWEGREIVFNRFSTHRYKSSSSFTSFEVLSAHIWRCWAKSLNLPRNQVLKLLFSINIRKRIKPNLPNGYYGNAFVLGCAETTVKELVENGLGYGSLLVKKAKERVNDEYVREVVELVSGPNGKSPDSVGVLILSQWSRLGLENIDIGLGRPVFVGPVCCDKYCILLPVYDQKDSVKVSVAIPESAVEKYLCCLKI